jgi:hypothetical protein
MQKIKIIVDGIEPSKNEIYAKQNFSKVLKEYHKKKPTIFRSPWFYGVVGLSSLLFFTLIN